MYFWNFQKFSISCDFKYSLKSLWPKWGGLAGHVVDGMATAVENADILVVCISQNYFDSKNCKKELEYADELGTRFLLKTF